MDHKKLSLFILIILLAPMLFTVSVSAMTQAQLNSVLNNTEFYDPSANCSATLSSSGNANTANLHGQNIEQIFQFFTQNGYTPTQAAAIAGNISMESGGDPEIYEGNGKDYQNPPGNLGWGIVQWTPPTEILQYAQSINQPAYNLTTQLKLLLQELSTNEAQAGKDLKSTTTINNAVAAFEGNTQYGGSYVGFERPANELQDFLPRLIASEQILNQYGSTVASSNPSSANNSSSVNTITTTSINSCGNVTQTTVNNPYQNPFRSITNLVSQRIDQGVDYDGTGPIYAIGDGTVNGIYPNWYLNEPLVAYTLSNGPAAGKVVYVAECITPSVQKGETVTPNTVIATMINCGNGIETGWANPNLLPTSMAYSCWDQVSSNFGVNFSQLLQSLGAKPGIPQEANPPCTLPSGWPTW